MPSLALALLLCLGSLVSGVTPLRVTGTISGRPLSSYQWNLRAMKVFKGWKLAGERGAGVTVCDVDTGLTPSTDVSASQIASGLNLVDPGMPTAWADNNGHGTFTASEIVGSGTLLWGVAPDARVIAIKVLTAIGAGGYDVVDAGILACVARGAQVINLSLGGPSTPFDGMAATVKIACNAGVLIAVASGNARDVGKTTDPASITSPCLIAVAATTKSGAMAGFSNVDENPRELDAPGQNVLGDAVNGGAAMASGTSMAAPEVAGAMAVLLGMDVPPRQVVADLLDSADHASDFQPTPHTSVCTARGYDITEGCGDLNLAAAVRLVQHSQ